MNVKKGTVIQMIKSLDTSKVAGPDNMHPGVFPSTLIDI